MSAAAAMIQPGTSDAGWWGFDVDDHEAAIRSLCEEAGCQSTHDLSCEAGPELQQYEARVKTFMAWANAFFALMLIKEV